MNKHTVLSKILSFFLTKIIIGIAIVGGSVVFTEWAGRLLLANIQVTGEIKNLIIALGDSGAALFSYIFLFRVYEKRQIAELSSSTFCKYAIIGFATGSILQLIFILVIFLANGYSVLAINPLLSLIPALAAALTAGFVAEILIRGIFFRLTEQKFGTEIALLIITLLFGLLHLNAPGATILSVITTAIEAGFLLSAAYVFTRSLWSTIFLHFAWDFAEPGIFGGINPGITEKSLLISNITGSDLFTGGKSGPQNSMQALIVCFTLGLLFIYLAKRNHSFIKGYWKK
jgi:uncharacterized protein